MSEKRASYAVAKTPEITDDFLRWATAQLKVRFLRWKRPPVELPAESVVEDTIRAIVEGWELLRTGEVTPRDLPDLVYKAPCTCVYLTCPSCGRLTNPRCLRHSGVPTPELPANPVSVSHGSFTVRGARRAPPK